MKASELMIGDWVNYRGINIKITSLYDKGGSNEIGWGVKEATWVNGRCIEPIPLTVEILKKNGFEYLSLVNKYIFKEEGEMPIHLEPFKDGWIIHINCDNLPMDLHYVHELQQAIRLCKLSKEIEL